MAAVVEAVRLGLAPVLQAATQLSVEVDLALVVPFALANLRSVVYDLLRNAVEYRDPTRPSVVQVWAERHPQGIRLRVQDDRPGLTELQQRQLFGLFQRLHPHVEDTGAWLLYYQAPGG